MVLLRAFLGVLACAFAADAPTLTYGHYEGTLHPRGVAFPVAASLELFVGQEQERAARVFAIVKAKLGKYGEGEYTTYYFPEVPFSYESSVLTLAQKDVPLRVVLQTSAKRLEGKFELVSDGSSGVAQLDLVSPFPRLPHGHVLGTPKEVAPERNELETLVKKLGESQRAVTDVMPRLAGDYYGHCGTQATLLHVETFRGLSDAEASNQDSLRDYEIQASMGFQDCPPELTKQRKDVPYCLTNFFGSGHYHLSGQLRFKGIQGSLRCKLVKEKWECENATVTAKNRTCTFSPPASKPPPSNENIHELWLAAYRDHMERVEEMDVEPLPDDPEATDVGGDYLGYLFLHDRGRAQLTELKLLAAFATPNSHTPEKLFLMPAISFFLGLPSAREKSTQPLDRRPFLHTAPNLLFSGDGDGIFQVVSWSRGIIEGLWLSKSYGLVGPAVLMRGRAPMASRKIAALESLTGHYVHPKWKLRLDVGEQEALPSDPLWRIEGTYHLGDGSFATQAIEKGNYQPYTGDIYLQVEKVGNDRGKRVIAGKITPEGNLAAVFPVNRTHGTEIVQSEPAELTRQKEPKE